jgi:hypothetical protein
MNPLFALMTLPLALNGSLHRPVHTPADDPVGVPGTTFSDQCTTGIYAADQIEIQSNWDATAKSCTVSVNPQDAENLIYRSFLWDETGLFMVFNSYGSGPDDTMTGARDFYLFPRKGLPAFREAQPGVIELRSASGEIFQFATQNEALTGLEGGDVSVSSSIATSNAGGVEITQFQGVLLDCGFELGNQPETNMNGTSTFRDPQGNKCTVTNSEVFQMSGENPILKYSTDAALATFLKTRCPSLNVVDLANP